MGERLPEKEQAEDSIASGDTHALQALWRCARLPIWRAGFNSLVGLSILSALTCRVLGMEKRCYACQEVKPLGEFPINRTRADGRGSKCKACKSVYNGTYYLATKDRHNPARAASRRRAQAAARERLSNYLRKHPCVDCGETDIIVLQFDHQSDKEMNVADLVGRGHGWPRILEEIAKCEVVCANDHLRRTARSRGWYKAVVTQAPLAQLARAADS